jgi:hypothetical protein
MQLFNVLHFNEKHVQQQEERENMKKSRGLINQTPAPVHIHKKNQ